ncbi:hypothetical protein N9L11_01580 [Euryarchaeota archaeon]|nr:hypothetical protein [Euryarchaeota archaeon]
MLSNKAGNENQSIIHKESNDKEQAIEPTNGHFFDGYIISPRQYSQVSLYTCNARSYSGDDFNDRLAISKRLKQKNGNLKTANFKRFIATNIPLTQDEIKTEELNELSHPSDYLLNGAKKQLMEYDFKYGWNHPDFNRSKSKLPVLALGNFRQYLEYRPRVYHFHGRFILRPNPSMSYSRTDTCHDLLLQEELSVGSNLSYVYQSRSCVLRNITQRTISDKDPTLGISLIEFYRKDPKYAPYMAIMESRPEMKVLEVNHDRFNQGKNTAIYSIAACLLTPDIRLDDIPDRFRKRFMINSHVDMGARFHRVHDFLNGLDHEKITQLLPNPVDISSLGLKTLKVQAKRLLFGDGYVTNNFSAYGNFSSLKNHKLFKSPGDSQIIGIIPYKNKSDSLANFANDVKKELGWIGVDCSLEFLEPYDHDDNGRLNQFELAEKYGSVDADCLLVELQDYSENWTTWKNALGTKSSQMITTNKMRKSGVSFNTTLGIASCLGSMPIGLDGNLTGIQVWIGMDVYSEGKKHIAAASTVCDATGMLIGYPPSATCSGERLDDSAFEQMMRIIMDGVTYHYTNENRRMPSQIGLIRDGQFFENPRILEVIEKDYRVSIVVVDVKKQGSPKLAVENGLDYISADCGTLICNSNGGYIQTTGNGSSSVPGTPVLRHIRLIRGDVEISHLLEDLFWLSKIHGGSTRQPGLPIPQAYAHKLAERAGRGVQIPNTFNTDMSFL